MSMSIADQQRIKSLEARVDELERQLAAMHAALELADSLPPPRRRPRKEEQPVLG